MNGHADDYQARADDLRDKLDEQKSWEKSTPAERAMHREWCAYGCSWCDGHREYGICANCSRDVEFDDLGVCRSCRLGGRRFIPDYDEDHIHPDAGSANVATILLILAALTLPAAITHPGFNGASLLCALFAVLAISRALTTRKVHP